MPVAVVTARGARDLCGGVRLAGNPTRLRGRCAPADHAAHVPQDEKFNYAAKQQVMSRYVALSERPDGSVEGQSASGLSEVT